MDFFVLVLVVAFIGAIIGIYQEISQIIGPVLVITVIIAGIALIGGIINRNK